MTTLIQNGLVCSDDRIRRADVLVRDGRIEEVAETVATGADVLVDADGMFVLPGFIDIHTHIADRIGPYTLADDYQSGTHVAVENGITTIATFVTETPEVPLEEGVAQALGKARGNCFADYWWHLTPTRLDEDGWSAIDRLAARGFRNIKLYTTYRQAGLYTDYDQLEWIFEKLSGRGIQFLVHCEDDEILSAVRLPDDTWEHAAAHAQSRPPQAEICAVREVLRRAERQQAAVHIVHVSTPGALELIQDARASVRVTCETCPQYLFLDDSWLQREDGHRWICSPPLRTAPMRDALAAMAADGAVDLFATDHCAFTCEDKDRHRRSIREVPNGLAGIGALPHLVYALHSHCGTDAMMDLTRRLSANPARLLGVFPRKGTLRPGADADLCICRVSSTSRPLRSSLARVHETYPGMNSGLHVEHVFLRGSEIVCDGRMVNPDEKRGMTSMAGVKSQAWRNDAIAKVTGRTKYADDLKFVAMLHAAPVYADHVHARLIAVHTEKAERAEGVVRVLTARDVPGVNRHGQIIRDFRVFADDKIRYHGDVVALVVARSRDEAIRAADLVQVEAEPLPAVLDPDYALSDGAPLIHEDHGTNIINTHRVRRGNVEEGLSALRSCARRAVRDTIC